MTYRTEAPAPPRDRTISFEDTDCIMTTDTNEPDYSDHFCIEQEDGGHRYHVVSLGGETCYETRREAIEAAREYGNTAELNRLAARVAELEECHALECNARNRVEAELAKLRAAAAPVELPEGWDPVEDQGDGTRYMNGPWNDEMWHHADDTLRVSSEGGEATVPAAAVRHLLALPPQEDVAEWREAFAAVLNRPERGQVWTGGGCAFEVDSLRPADLCAWAGVRWPTAPRTEGGGEHGE